MTFGSTLTEKLLKLEDQISAERAGFALFALMQRVQAEGVQDLVVSATWLDPASKRDLQFIVEKVKEVLVPEELRQLSAVVILGTDNPIVQALNSTVSIEHSSVMFQNCTFGDLAVKGALVVTSKRRHPWEGFMRNNAIEASVTGVFLAPVPEIRFAFNSFSSD